MNTAGYAAIYDPDTDFDRHYTAATGDRIAIRLGPRDRVLELGCATGAMTARLAGEEREVVAVDRAASYLARARGRALPGVRWLIGDLDAPSGDFAALPLGDHDVSRSAGRTGASAGDVGAFDHVVLANVLHELDDPAGLLRRVAREHLAPGGLVHVSLQNPRSLHRLVALEMGLIDALEDVSDAGRRYATRRLYGVDEVAELAAEAGLEIAHREGVMLKPLPNDAMAALPDDVLAGFVTAARHLPDHGAMNLFVLRRAA